METRGPLALTPEIEEFRQQFEQLITEVDAFVAPLGDTGFAWQPAPDRWSVAQCVDHLNATARTYLPVLDEGITDAIRRGLYGRGPYAYNWVGRLLVYLMRPNSWFRAKAPRSFAPAPSRPRQEIMAAFRAYQVQYIDRLRQANGLDLARARVASPVARWLRMSLGSAFLLLITHERRHLAQAQRVLQEPGFPR
ncbi:MAG: DinB family protein [Vicinamibacterales bacterium]